MPRQRYRLATSTLVVHRQNGGTALITIPQGAIIIVDTATSAKGMVAIVWEGKQVTMFAEDLHARGVPLEALATNEAALDGL